MLSLVNKMPNVKKRNLNTGLRRPTSKLSGGDVPADTRLCAMCLL